MHTGETAMIRTTLVAFTAAAGLALAGCGESTPPAKPAPKPAPVVVPAPAPAPAPVLAPAPVEHKSTPKQQKSTTPQKSTTQQQKSTKSQPKSSTSSTDPYPNLPNSRSGMDCQGGPDGHTVCAGGSAEQNRKAEKQGDAEYKQFCQQQSTKPQMCQQMGY